MIVAGLATIIGREEMAQAVVKEIYPQVDILHVCFSGCLKIPEWVNEYPNLKPELDPMNILHDTAKLKWTSLYESASYLCIDDDISYPDNYVSFMTGWLDKFDNKAVVGLHGRSIDYTKRVNYCWTCETLCTFPVMGTGAVAFSTDYIQFDISDFMISMANADYMMALKIARENKCSWILPRSEKMADSLEETKSDNYYPTCGKSRKRNPYVQYCRKQAEDELQHILDTNGSLEYEKNE